MKNTIQRLNELGQSAWCDNLSRSMIDSTQRAPATSGLRSMMAAGIVGVTSNPTIFMKAITTGVEYDARFDERTAQGLEGMSLYEGLVVPDIADAADLLRPVYDETNRLDGLVSLEVDPRLARDTRATVAEARRLFKHLDRPNVFIKVPATPEGIPAIETLIGEGININVTLIFSLTAYDQVMRAYLSGLKRLYANGGDLTKVASVASFFVSRVDSLVDKLLSQHGHLGETKNLIGKAAIANAKLAYRRFEEVFHSRGEFGELARFGARVQRPLWASTSTKNPSFPDTVYVDQLIGPHTVNTMPPETILAVLDHGTVATTIHDGLSEAEKLFAALARLGIDIDAVTKQLEIEGVNAFVKSFDELLSHLDKKSARACTAKT